ncbi:MAG: hypothetical protein ACLSHO_09575 [Dysosmobacter sp.]
MYSIHVKRTSRQPRLLADLKGFPSVEMAIQVNGKMKGTVTVAVDSDEETVKAAALSVDKVQKATEGMQIVKTILVKNRLINLIVKPR